jgi:hypothetical protein
MKTESSRIIDSELRGNAGTWDDSALVMVKAASDIFQSIAHPRR